MVRRSSNAFDTLRCRVPAYPPRPGQGPGELCMTPPLRALAQKLSETGGALPRLFIEDPLSNTLTKGGMRR